MARPRKDALTDGPRTEEKQLRALTQRIELLEDSLVTLTEYIVDRYQIRGFGPDSHIVGIIRRFKT